MAVAAVVQDEAARARNKELGGIRMAHNKL